MSEALIPSVLVVDDDDPFRTVLSRALRRHGVEVREAGNGLEARDKIQEDAPSVLITDMLMPECDGVELITAVRRLCPDLPIVAMSARRHIKHLDLLDLAKRLGADAVYPKDHDVEVLLNILNTFPV